MAILTTNKFKLDNLSSLTGLTSSDVILVERYDTSKDDRVHFNVNQDYLARSVVSCLHFSSGKGVGDLSAIDYLSVQYVNGGFSSLLACVPTSRGILSAAEYSDETHVLSLLFNALDSEYGIITVDLGSLVDVYSGDANSESGLSSIYLSSNGNFFELYNFHEDNYTADDLSSIIDDNHLSTYDVLLKHKDSNSKHILEYMPLSSILYNGQIGSIQVSGDANVIKTRRSVEFVNNLDPYYQLYSFGNDSTIGLDPIRHHGAFDFVVRYHNAASQREEIQYGKLDLSSIAPISGDVNVIPNAQKTIVTEEDQQGNIWHQLYGLGDTGIISAVMSYDGYDHYIMNEGLGWTNPNKQFLYYDYTDKRLKYGDICLYMPKVTASDLDDDVLPEISDVIIPEVSTIISAELSAFDDKYWIKGEDETENCGSAIGNTQKTKVIDLDNKELVGQWRTDSDFTCDTNISCDQLMAGGQVTISQSGLLQIGNTTLNETQLQQLLALLNA